MKIAISRILKVLFFDVKAPLIALVGLAVFSSILTGNLLTKYPELAGLIKGPEIIKKEEDALIAEVRSIIELPADERPTVATVTEPEKLSGQKFFEKAKNGDRILVYNQAGKAVLYRPDEKRVVELGNLSITQNQNAGEVAGEDVKDEEEPEESATPEPTNTPEPVNQPEG